VVEHTRVGAMTEYDRLILEILTDGAMEPDEALAAAAQILVDHARVFADFNRKDRELTIGASPFISEEVQNKPLSDLGLSPRVLNALRSKQIDRVGQVLQMDPDQLLAIRNFGPRSLNELRQKLAEFGYLPEGEVAALPAEGDFGEDEEEEADEDGAGANDVAEALASLQDEDAAVGTASGDDRESGR